MLARDLLREGIKAMRRVVAEDPQRMEALQAAGLLDEAVERTALAAIIVHDLQCRRTKEYDFNWARLIDFRGASGPYLQYTHARLLRSVHAKSISHPLFAPLMRPGWSCADLAIRQH